MAYAPAYGRPPPQQRQPPPQQQQQPQQQYRRPQGPMPPAARGQWQQPEPVPRNHNNNYNNNQPYQQDWSQNDYGGYQDYDDSYQDYAAANPYYDNQPQSQSDAYGTQYSSWDANGQGYRERRDDKYDQRYNQGYNQPPNQTYQQSYGQQGYNSGYQNYPDYPRGRPAPPNEAQQRPPPQNYPPRGPPPNGMDGPAQSRARPPPAPQNQSPPTNNSYQSIRPPNEPNPPRSSARHQDHTAFQTTSPTEMAWDNPFPKWPTKRDNSREPPSARASQDRSRHSAEQQPQSGRPSQEQNHPPPNGYGNDYNGRTSQQQQQQPPQPQPPQQQQQQAASYINGPAQWEREQRPPPNFSRTRELPPDGRPSTATGGGRPVPHKLDIPQQSRAQSATPTGQGLGSSYSYSDQTQPSRPRDPMSHAGYDRNINSAFEPSRPGTAPTQGQQPTQSPSYYPSNGRPVSPEEMPAFGNPSNGAETDSLHTTTPVERSGSQTQYTAYSPQAVQQKQNSFGTPRASADRDQTPYSAGPWSSREGPPAQYVDAYAQEPPQDMAPLRRSVTSDDQSYGRAPAPAPAPAPGSRPGPPPGQWSHRDPRGPRMDDRPPPSSNRQLNNIPTDLPYGRPRPPGPHRTSSDRPDSRSRAGPGGAGPPTGLMTRPGGSEAPQNPKGPSPRPNPPRSNSADPRQVGPANGPPSQPPQPSEPQERKPDPDSLPHHPTPVRPGLMAGGPPSKEKPPPVRQYNGASQDASGSAKKSKRKSSPVTEEELSRLRAAVSKNPSDNLTQFKLAKKLAEAAIVLSDDGGRADARMKAHNQQRFNGEAKQILKKLTANNDPDAMFFLADSYSEGKLGVQQDPKEAFNLYQSAAKLGHAGAAYRTAVCCEIGPEEGGGTMRDTQKAIQWYKRASSLGDVPATFKVGIILLKGLMGVQKNLNEAIVYLKKAADRADEENPHALHELGLLYEAPSNPTLHDESYALEVFTRAANLGYKFSQFKLGQAYEYGLLGCKTDPRNSIVWYTKAAAQGEHEAELALSGWYLTGSEGILEHNDTEAYLWARKAATADPSVPKALFAMGYFTEIGIGCPRSLDEAKKWYGRSAALNFPKAQQRLDELRRGGANVQKNRERLSRSNQRQHEENCIVM